MVVVKYSCKKQGKPLYRGLLMWGAVFDNSIDYWYWRRCDNCHSILLCAQK